MCLALENCRYELPQVLKQVVASDVIRYDRKFTGSRLLDINNNIIGFFCAGTRGFLVIRVRALFNRVANAAAGWLIPALKSHLKVKVGINFPL